MDPIACPQHLYADNMCGEGRGSNFSHILV